MVRYVCLVDDDDDDNDANEMKSNGATTTTHTKKQKKRNRRERRRQCQYIGRRGTYWTKLRTSTPSFLFLLELSCRRPTDRPTDRTTDSDVQQQHQSIIMKRERERLFSSS